MKFLHIADVHLGCTRYQLPESPRDFYEAWVDVLRRYAIGEKVDFVIMCGDFFHKKAVPPETMNYAVEGLTMMREAGIPVVAIEGNHDQRPTDNEFSWLRSLSRWGLVTLLEPTRVESETAKGSTLVYEPWDERTRRGGYIDIGNARIFGSDWYGASGNTAIPMLTRSIKADRRDGAFHILMLHTDVEGHQVHPIPALTIEALSELKTAVEYVGLGHTHKHYEIDNWAFNPGSIEVTNISEFREQRGAFIVEVAEDGTFTSRHVDEYHHRPFQQLSYDVDSDTDAKAVTTGVLALVDREARRAESGKPQPIIEIALRGQLGFPNSTLELAKIRDSVKQLTDALHVRIKNHTIPADFTEAVETANNDDRERLERRVVAELVRRDTRYATKYEEVADAVIGAKRMALSDDEPGRIADFIAVKLKGDKASA
ncbi:MAG TPA: exonuclease SbcCD subunit D [Pyrinomonadaceae bacterium]|nr:exonuclease SbcCD subunit D [Pyrinomonadaceae bacterium]